MRILVTGASGFIGRRLVDELTARGHEVVAAALDRRSLSPEVRFEPLEVRDPGEVRGVVDRVAPERIVHLAALAHVGESWRMMPEYFAVNVLGTDNVLAAARRNGSGVPVLLASSAEVYGAVPESEQPIAESRPVAPRSPYALTKAAAERLALAAGATIARCFNLVGAGQAPGFALPSFARQLAAIARGGEPVLRVGNLTARRDFLHVADGVAALTLLAEAPRPAEIFNVAAGVDVSIAEALDRLILGSGLRVSIVEDPEKLRPIDVPRLCGSSARLAALGWKAGRSFDQALAEIWDEARSEVAA